MCAKAPNKNFKQDKIQLAFCSLRSPILANYILPLKWALGNQIMFSVVSKMNNSPTIGYLYLTLGILMVIGGFYFTKSTSDFIDIALPSEGVVLELVQKDESLYPKIEFQDHTGKSHIFVANFGCSPACYKEQDSVKVLYNSNKVMDIKIDSFMGLWFASLILFSIGIIFVIFSLFQLKRLKIEAA
jgi:hypothetical protein